MNMDIGLLNFTDKAVQGGQGAQGINHSTAR